ncbi:MAG: glucan biosynthesis protein G [Gammaproteobacteria bacterium]
MNNNAFLRTVSVPVILAVVACFAVPAGDASGKNFDFSDVVRIARAQAARPFALAVAIPESLTGLSYNQYQQIRFKPEDSLWYGTRWRFHVQPVPAGLYYNHCVALNVISARGVAPLRFSQSDFSFPSAAFARKMPRQLCAAGFKLTYPLAGPGIQNQFLVFAGASYFRAVGRSNRFGLSARGLAINTAFPPGEEFPTFRRFWLQEPAPDVSSFTLYALLSGASVTGAYRFEVTPGDSTVLAVKAVLFFRQTPRVTGIAPLTSMFLYGEGTPRPPGEWRPAVHDSGGLQIENGDHEWLWRPLINPLDFLVSSFTLDNPRGFGLMQRDQNFSSYEDLGARYDLRPSAWVVPENAWGKGRVELVEIPSPSETEDNIVAYWVPQALLQPERAYTYQYKILFGKADEAQPPAGYVVHTFVGSGHNPGLSCKVDRDSLRFVVDFAGRIPQGTSDVQGIVSAGGPVRIQDVSVERNEPVGGYRLSFRVTPEPRHPLELRAFLRRGPATLTETWSYLLPWGNVRRLLAIPGCPADGGGR